MAYKCVCTLHCSNFFIYSYLYYRSTLCSSTFRLLLWPLLRFLLRLSVLPLSLSLLPLHLSAFVHSSTPVLTSSFPVPTSRPTSLSLSLLALHLCVRPLFDSCFDSYIPSYLYLQNRNVGMGIGDLSIELLESIIDFTIQDNWVYHSEERSVFKLRLVCSKAFMAFICSSLCDFHS